MAVIPRAIPTPRIAPTRVWVVEIGNPILEHARTVAREFAQKDSPAFCSIKRLLRKSVAEEMKQKDEESTLEFIDLWYSESTMKNLKEKKIYA